MKQKKLRLPDLQSKLSREEMKRIMAGSDGTKENCNCHSKAQCSSGQICGADCKGGNGYEGHCTTY